MSAEAGRPITADEMRRSLQWKGFKIPLSVYASHSGIPLQLLKDIKSGAHTGLITRGDETLVEIAGEHWVWQVLPIPEQRACPKCAGRGTTEPTGNKCQACNGSGAK
jgi:hypothetical protein